MALRIKPFDDNDEQAAEKSFHEEKDKFAYPYSCQKHRLMAQSYGAKNNLSKEFKKINIYIIYVLFLTKTTIK